MPFETAQEIRTSSPQRAQIVRDGHIAETIVVVNGLFGCGKTLMTAVIGSLDRMELMRYNYPLEYTCVLRHLGSVEADAASSLIRIGTDLDLHNVMMGRETNFRFSDLSSVWRNAVNIRYLTRLWTEGDATVMKRIRQERPILHLVTHMLLGVSRPLFEALGERLRFVEVLRHPLYMIKQWHLWIPRAGKDPRAFEVWINYKGRSLPWYAHGWEERYLQSNDMDRVIYCIDRHWRMGLDAYRKMSDAQKSQVLFLPFEPFVLDPNPFMQKLERFIGTRSVPATRRMMKRQRVPRKKVAQGLGLKIYKHCGWEPPGTGSTEADELAKRRGYAQAEATPEAMRVLDRLCREYEESYYKPQRDR